MGSVKNAQAPYLFKDCWPDQPVRCVSGVKKSLREMNFKASMGDVLSPLEIKFNLAIELKESEVGKIPPLYI